SGLSWASYPRFADSPGPAFCRPLRGLRSFLGFVPPVRGLTGGQRSVARFAGSGLSWASYPGSRTHRGATFCSPLRGLMLLTSTCDGRSMALPTLGVLVPSISGDFSFGFLRIAVQSEHQTRPFLALLSVP